MCGIAGAICSPGESVATQLLQQAADLMVDRGPDDCGFLGWWPAGGGRIHATRNPHELEGAQVALVHRRLSVLDLSTSAWQPMCSRNSTHHLVFNGEIYNYRELRSDLEKQGATFQSTGDSEVLLEAFRSRNVTCLPDLVGMFAFALLDSKRRNLTLARDAFGIKPLYFSTKGGRFVFASSIKALLTLAPFSATADRQAAFEYLRYGLTDHSSRTVFEYVFHLPAGHFLQVDVDDQTASEPVCFWRIEKQNSSDISFDDAASTLRRIFLENIDLHLRSDVPVGAALSGGIDSSSIVMAMREVAGADLDLHTVSFHAQDPAVSETSWIEIVNSASGAIEHRVDIQAGELIEDMDALIRAQEEPFGSTSIYAQYRVFRAAAEAGLTVMLDGQGADELLGGYHLFLASRLVSLLGKGRLIEAFSFAQSAAARPGSSWRNLLYVLGSQVTPPGLENLTRRIAGKPFIPCWLSTAWFSSCNASSSPLPKSLSHHGFHHILKETITRTSLPMLLRWEDRNSMAFSIESRVPFLTTSMAEFVFSLPEEYIVDRRGQSKNVFRSAMRGLVPGQILDRKDKIGFATPELSWLGENRAWVERILFGETARNLPALHMPEIRREWEGVIGGTLRFDWRIWRLICFIRWAELFSVSFAD
jgi:asparagine synthase (glutamine-hydrolysing)